MAKVLGESGRFVKAKAADKQQRIITLAFWGWGITAWISGFLFGSLPHRPVGCLASIGLLVALIALQKRVFRRVNHLERERDNYDKGAQGEITVGSRIEQFPDSFFVINDIPTPLGNLDHVVVGPTGVFALETKNWKGRIEADGKGEMLLNGKALDEPQIKPFVKRVMRTRDRLKALVPDIDPFIQALFVFTSASVDANWGETGAVHCLRDEKLYPRIVEDKKPKRRLSSAEVEKIALAFRDMARTEPGFESEAIQCPNAAPVPAT